MKTELILAALLTGLTCFAQVEPNPQIPSAPGKDFVVVERILNLVGIGAVLKKQDEKLMIMEVVPNAGAEQAGLKKGDAITHVDGKPVALMEFNEAVPLIRGNPDTTVILKIERFGESPRDVTVTRQPVLIPDSPK